jgi:hypothetical protein
MAPSVLLIGASGALGRPLVEEFQKQRARFNRVAILADLARAHKFSEVQKNGIEVISGSFLDFKVYQGVSLPFFTGKKAAHRTAGFDTVLSLVGNALMRLQPAIIEAAVAGGVRHFYPSEFGTDIALDGVWQFRYFRDKVVTRDHLAATAKRVVDFRYTLMLTGAFSDWAVGEFSGVDVEKHTVKVYGYPEAEVSVTALKECVGFAFGLFER